MRKKLEFWRTNFSVSNTKARNGTKTDGKGKNIKTYLSAHDYNVIIVDWSTKFHVMYNKDRRFVKELGMIAAHFIDRLSEETGFDMSRPHIVVHSLGAHVCGVGWPLHKKLSWKNTCIILLSTGLDPAKPMFSVDDDDRLCPAAASFVDVIQTCGQALGMYEALGHAVFYPNQRKPRQPGCGTSAGWWKSDNSKATDGIEDRVDFYLYTQRTLGTPVKTNIRDTKLFGGKINVAKPVKIVIHGWSSNKDAYFPKTIREAYLNKGDFNVINVDYSQDARYMYPTAKKLAPAVGKVIAKFIDKLVAETGLKAEQIHVLGHSLGAHVAGVTGLNVKSGRLMRVTGLDPAGPLYSYKDEERLKPSSALFVDVIHTGIRVLGFNGDLGVVDFYPNKGTVSQPGCLMTKGCSHQRVVDLYAESIKNPKGFLARKCDQWKDFSAKKCEINPTAFMGEYVGYDARGKYWLRTEKSSPYALGIKGV